MILEENSLTAFIFCRGGSKGVPGKNIYPINGRPLLAYSIDCALASKYISRVIVSTDDADIAQAAKDNGADVLLRPAALATDTASEILAWRHAISETSETLNGLFVSLPATSPLRAPEDVDNAIERYAAGGADVIFGISESHRNPFLNMVQILEDGLISVVNKDVTAHRRQDVPEVFDVTTCTYVAGVDYINDSEKLMDGRVGYIMIPASRALDIDTPFDMHLAELLINTPFKNTN